MTGNKVKKSNPSNKGGLISFLRGVKNEFKRIAWPSKEETKKALIAVSGSP